MKKFYKILIAIALVTAVVVTYRAPIVDAGINAIRQLKADLTNGRVPVAAGNLSGMSGDITVASTGVTTIGAGAVESAMLESGLSPSHVALYSGEITWTGSGATLTSVISGVVATDILQVTIHTVPTQAAYLVAAEVFGNNSTLFTLSAANTSNDAVMAYTVFRAAP